MSDINDEGKILKSWRIRFSRFLALSAFVLLVSLQAGNAFAGTLIYFYNPDANLRDVAKLKTEVEKYFRSIDSKASLKAFLKLRDLQSAVSSKSPDFLVVSSWTMKQFSTQYGFKPLLSGRVGAKSSYQKVLIAKKTVTGASPSLSMVSIGDSSTTAIKALVPTLKKYANLSIVEVSKDLDAVLAVSFGQVDMALVRSRNIDAIRSVNKAAVAGIKVLARSTPIQYPIFLASATVDAPLVEKYVNGLKTARDQKAAQALDLMGFESWGAL